MEDNRGNNLPDVVQTVVINAPIGKVWEKVSTAEGIAQWFMPNDFQAELGHEFHLQSPFGPTPCKVTELDPPNSLAFTWDTEGWTVSFLLKELGDQTEFTLVHGGWKQPDELIGKANEKSSVIHGRMAGGWAAIVQERLKKAAEA
ncbi:SRPBCC domain-containing protein [Paenibacillus sp. 7124]|uniref:SRPBCC domain-containing protein n=1 Tax=Paenibacillus apii TaxID=1850370 RepID=A0A6M1PP58_9BACL|nr:SRPBCC domain-containing protein [Paenibacillus apii]NGM82091.1 SRPBCC domain-containing protein [Paenibacillus apii]NJJ39226.1 SRPBCC domain-containing protein [Paenibacillus apii]